MNVFATGEAVSFLTWTSCVNVQSGRGNYSSSFKKARKKSEISSFSRTTKNHLFVRGRYFFFTAADENRFSSFGIGKLMVSDC